MQPKSRPQRIGYMGKGDKRSRKGKRSRGSYGRSRPKKKADKNTTRKTPPRGR